MYPTHLPHLLLQIFWKEYMPMKFLLFYRKGELTQDITLLIRHLKNCIQQNIDISHPYPY